VIFMSSTLLFLVPERPIPHCENLTGKIKRPPGWEAKMHAYVGVHLHEYYDNRDNSGTHES
jgi:hypothetical protein